MSSYGRLAPHYDALTKDVPYSELAAFYEEIFRLYGLQPRSVIDLACGTGSMTLELGLRGYDLTSVDRSPDMLSVAMDKVSGLEPRPLLVCQDLEELDLYGTSDAAVCTLDGMNYVPDRSLARVFQRIRLFLNPGGLLVFDVIAPRRLKELDGQVFLDETDDVFCVWRADYSDEEDACVYGMDLFEKSGRLWSRSREEHREYAHPAARLRELLESGGYTDIRFFGDRRTDDPSAEDDRIFCAARKPFQEDCKADG